MWKKLLGGADRIIRRIDGAGLFWLGILFFVVVFAPFAVLKGGSVFEIHDQLDESMMNYVLTAKHPGQAVIPEIFQGGVSAGGMQPAAVFFLPLYRILSPLKAFLVQYAICFIVGFFGMYFCVRELTGSNIWATVLAGCFVLLPMYPVYGLSEYGIPMLIYACLCLYKRKHIVLSFLAVFLYGGTSHLVCTGYVMLAFWLFFLLVLMIARRRNHYLEAGFFMLLTEYVVINYRLFYELLLGGGDFVSHREEMVNYAQPFFQTFADVLINSAQHAPSYHKYLIVPIAVALAAGGICYKKLDHKRRLVYTAALGNMLLLIGIALFCAICESAFAVEIKNSLSGFLHYFQAERFYWFYPAGWYLEAALCIGLWWNGSDAEATAGGKDAADGKSTAGGKNAVDGKNMAGGKDAAPGVLTGKAVIIAAVLLPTVSQIIDHSIFYQNVNQYNNGSAVTGYVTWEAYYAEDLMEELESVIGRDISTYRIAHLGVSPAPSLMHGFYTVDGYSNNYPLEYKHRFRQVIEKELEKNEEARVYFDEWGNRCYLFNSVTGIFYKLARGNELQYSNLELDMEKLADLGCEYLFSGAEIEDFEDMGLEYMGYYETEKSYWGIWLYSLAGGA